MAVSRNVSRQFIRTILIAIFLSGLANAWGQVAAQAKRFGEADSIGLQSDVELPQIFLNHIYVVLDNESFEAVRKSNFFNKRFAKTDRGLPLFGKVTDSDQSIYIRGKHTYLELLGPDNSFNEPIGKVGIGFCVEEAGAIDCVEKELQRQKLKSSRVLQQWESPSRRSVNWFDVVFVEQPETSPLVWWLSEYHADFLPALYPDRSPDETGILREQFLAPHYDSQRLFRDIHGLRLRLPKDQAIALTESLVAIGFEETTKDLVRRLASQDLTIRIETSMDPTAIRSPLVSIEISTNPSETAQQVKLGDCTVRLNCNGGGTIEFDDREPSSIVRHPHAVRRDQCFPLDGLPEESRELSQELLLNALDSEALYTFVGDLKPISEGFFDTWFQVNPADATKLSEVRKAISVWQCGNHYENGVLPFQQLRDGERFASGWIASRPALQQRLKDNSSFFHRLGMTRDSTAEAVLLGIEGADDITERWRGFGLVFGYPESAVEFFVGAGEHYATTGEFIERDFRNYPTHNRATGDFVYAVPKLQAESDDEKLLRRSVEAVLTNYRAHRTKYIIDDNPERVGELIRDWFDDGTGWCHPDHAMQKSMIWNEARDWVETEAIPLTTCAPSEPLEDLRQMDTVLKKPRIVSVGESTHGTREFFQLKHRLFRHQVENHGVRLFGIEASYAACLPIDEYIQTGIGDPRAAVKGQGFWTWDTEEVLALVEWMRDWNNNRAANTEPLRFFGFDTQDAYTPLKLVLEDLHQHTPESATEFRERLSIAMEKQYGQSLNSASREQLELLLSAVEELRDVCSKQEYRSQRHCHRTQLLLNQASAAIGIHLAERDQWSSMGMLNELELYTRIRARLPELESQIASLRGDRSKSLMDYVREAADLQRCQLRFRDELNDEQRQAWRDAVQWGIEQAGSTEVRALLTDLQKFLMVSTEYVDKPKDLANARDKSMARFVNDILDMQGNKSRIVLWTHDWHVSKIDGHPTHNVPRMGTYLKRAFDDDYLPIGLSFGSGGFQSKYYPEEGEDPAKMVLREFKLDRSRVDSFSYLFDHNEAPVSAYLIDESFHHDLPRWLSEPHAYRSIGALFQPKLENSEAYYEEMVLSQHFEVVLHVKKTERSRPLSPIARFRLGAELDTGKGSNTEAGDSPDHPDNGVLVTSVSTGSLAERSGIRVGDRIIQLDGHQVTSRVGLEELLADIVRPGSHEVMVLRNRSLGNGQTETQELTLFLIVPPWIVD